MARELDAKVASVMSATTIAINAGENNGVAYGDRVVVWRFVDVTDPDTGEELGRVRLANLRLRVSEVHERFSLARTDSETPNLLAGVFKPSKVIASSNRMLDENSVTLTDGDLVTVFVRDPLIIDEAEDVDGSDAER